MELAKKNIRLGCVEKTFSTMKTIDEDVNVPEAKKDITQIVCNTYQVHITNMKMSADSEIIEGEMEYDILYISNEQDAVLEHIEGSIGFEGKIELPPEMAGSKECRGKLNVEDFAVKIINSRKINIKALVEVMCVVDDISDDEIVCDVNDDGQVILRKENILFSQIKASMEDVLRIKEDVELPRNKPNVGNLLWSDMRLKSRETRIVDEGVYIKGDIGIFIMYRPDDEEAVTQWYETAIPFEGKIAVSGINEEMYAMIPLNLTESKVSVKADYDGEDRVLAVEGVITLDVKAYGEEEIPVVMDMYSTRNHIAINEDEKNYQQMIMKNNVKARGYEKIKLDKEEEKPLQVCYSYGTAHFLESTLLEEGIKVDGFVEATVIYVSDSDTVPVNSVKAQIPFSQTVSGCSTEGDLQYTIELGVEQVNASMISQDEIEVRVFVGIDVLILKNIKGMFIKEVEVTSLTDKELSEFPGIIGYIAPNEATLWDIAKKYKTTVGKIKNINKLAADVVKKGDKLVVVR